MLRPTAILDFQIDPAITNEETPIEIRRAYSYVAPMRIVDTETPEPPYEPANTLGLMVKLNNHPYWKSADEGADGIWSDVVTPWLHNKLIKVQSTVTAYNNTKREKGLSELHFKFLGLEMGEYRLTFENVNDAFSPEVEPCLVRFRDLINDGVLKDCNVAEVMIPWQDPEVIQKRYDEKLAAEKAAAEAEAAKAAADAALADAAGAAPADATAGLDLADGSAPEGAAAVADDALSADAASETEEVTEIGADNLEQQTDDISYETIDYSIWEITMTDGSKLLVDADEGELYTKPADETADASGAAVIDEPEANA